MDRDRTRVLGLLVVYLVLVALVARSPRVKEILGYARIGDATPVGQRSR